LRESPFTHLQHWRVQAAVPAHAHRQAELLRLQHETRHLIQEARAAMADFRAARERMHRSVAAARPALAAVRAAPPLHPVAKPPLDRSRAGRPKLVCD
jgi:hypothetical protein